MKVAAEGRITVVDLPPQVVNTIRLPAANKFAKGKSNWLWQYLEPDSAIRVQNPDAWRLISDFVGGNETYMFFNLSDNQAVLRFLNGLDIVSILEETPHFEFYLTNTNTDYLLCFNHHDYLVATGTAKYWLAQRIVEQK